MADWSIDSAWIVRVLAEKARTHRCTRCTARMLVKYESNLCVQCWNDLRASSLAEAEACRPVTVGGLLRLRRRAGDESERTVDAASLAAGGAQ